MAGPWEKYGNAQPTAPVDAPGLIRGRPKPVDPYKARDQQLQEEAAARAREDQALQMRKFEVDQQKAALDMQKTQRDLAPGADTTEGEKTAGFLATRVAGGIKELQRVTQKDPSAAAPTFGVETVRSIFGDTAANYFTDAERQQVVAAQTDILDAALTLGTGAAYTAEQLDGYRRSYFPQLGDDDATVKAKQQRLVQLLESAKVKAGRSAPMIDEALAAVGGQKQDFGITVDPTLFGSDGTITNPAPNSVPEGAEPFYDTAGQLLGYIGQDGLATILFDTPPPQDTPPQDTPPDNGGLMNGFMNGVGDVVETVGDTVGLLNNPLNAGVNALFGTDLTTDLGKSLRDGLGLPDNGNPYAKAVNQGGVSAMTGTGLGTLARNAPGAAGVVANALTQQPVAQVAGGVTGAVSAEGAKQAGLPWPVQLGAAMLGGMAGGSSTNALLNTGKKVPNQVAQAAQNQQIALMPADVGGPMVKRLSAAASQGAVSAGSVTKAAQNSQNQFRNAAQRASGGNRLAPDDAGEVVRSAGERFVKGSQQKGGALYTRAEKLAQGVSIKAKGAIQTIDDQISELSQAAETNAPLIQELQKFRADLANNAGVKVAGMRDLRTAAQKAAYTDSLRSTPAKRVLGIVAQSISDDINAGLQQAGRGNAAAAFKTADTYWRDRVEYIDSVLEPIIGKGKSGESIVQAVQSMAEGKGKGVQTLMKLMRSVEKDELADIQATVIDRLGKSSAGQQNAEGTGYSAATFLTNWSKMSEKGRIALFPDPALRKNLNELAMIADNMKQSSRYANSSQTAGAIAGQVVLSGGLGMASPTALLLAGGSQYLSGRLLASPKFANWLATVPKNPAAQQAHVKRLGAIAASEPVIANDILSVQKFLSQAPSTAKAAAGEQVNEERPKQP